MVAVFFVVLALSVPNDDVSPEKTLKNLVRRNFIYFPKTKTSMSCIPNAAQGED